MAARNAAAIIVRKAPQELTNNDKGVSFARIIRRNRGIVDTSPLHITEQLIAAESTAMTQLVEIDLK